MNKKRYYVVFIGRVQNVGFRWTVRMVAQSLGYTGWIRNLSNGNVDMEIQGSSSEEWNRTPDGSGSMITASWKLTSGKTNAVSKLPDITKPYKDTNRGPCGPLFSFVYNSLLVGINVFLDLLFQDRERCFTGIQNNLIICLQIKLVTQRLLSVFHHADHIHHATAIWQE